MVGSTRPGIMFLIYKGIGLSLIEQKSSCS